jgi:hypothetical protein
VGLLPEDGVWMALLAAAGVRNIGIHAEMSETGDLSRRQSREPACRAAQDLRALG